MGKSNSQSEDLQIYNHVCVFCSVVLAISLRAISYNENIVISALRSCMVVLPMREEQSVSYTT